MPRDYARTTRKKHKNSLPGWVWMLGGISIGLFVAFLVYLYDHTPASEQTRITQAVKEKFQEIRGKQKDEQAAKPASSSRNKQEQPQAQRPRFDFYTILPELEVAIPEQELISDKKKPHPVEDNASYILQAGSFRQHTQADRLKAKLALQGIEASIQTVTINDGDTWHRVRVGPFSDIKTLNRIRKRLHDAGTPSIVVRQKG